MATFQTQVEAISGTVSSTPNLNIWLTDGATDVTRKLISIKKADLPRMASPIRVSATNGLDLSNSIHIVSVTRGSYPAYEVPESMSWKVYQPDSIHKATIRNPAYYIKNNHLYVAPISSTSAYASYVPLHNVLYTDTNIPRFPDEYNYAVVLYASMQNIVDKMRDTTAPADVTLPVPPVVGTFTSVATALPTYTEPTGFVLPTAPVSTDVDFSDVGSIPVFVEPSTISLPSMGDLGTAPTYSAPELTMTSVAALTELVVPPPPVLEEVTDSEAPDAPPDAVLSFAHGTITLGAAPVYTAPVNDLYSTAMTVSTTHLDTNHDIELAQVKLQQVSAAVAQYQADMQNAAAKFNEDNVRYQADLQRQIEQLRHGNEGEGLEARLRLESYQAQVQAYVSRVNVASINNKSALDAYQAELTGALQKWQLEQLQGLQGKWIAARTSEINKFQSDIQNAANDLAASTTEYQATVQKVLQTYQVGSTSELNRYANQLQNNSQEFNAELQVWSKQIDQALATYERETGLDVAVYRAQVEAEVARYKADVEAAIAKINAQLNIYAHELQSTDEANKRVLAVFSAEVGIFQAESTAAIQNFTAALNKRQLEYTWLESQYAKLGQQYNSFFMVDNSNTRRSGQDGVA